MLGAGVISASHALALRGISGAKLIAVCDRDSEKAQACAAQWSIPEVFSSLDEMLAKSCPDVVHVLLPPSAHAGPAIDCLEAGAHVLIEKPFCLSVRDCRAVENAAARANRIAGVNHNLTFMPGILKLLNVIRSLQIGEVEHVSVTYNLVMPALAAGQHGHWMFGSKEHILFELGPHPLSVICRLLGRVTGSSTTLSGHTILNNGQSFYDTWQSSLVCERGSAQILLALGREYLSTGIHVIGQDGEVFVNLRRNTVQVSGKTRWQRADNLVDSWRNGKALIVSGVRNFSAYVQGAVGAKPAYELQDVSMAGSIGAFYGSLFNRRPLAADAAEGTAVVEACESILESGENFLQSRSGVYSDASGR